MDREIILKHISGCKKYDFIDMNNKETKYDEKTFTLREGVSIAHLIC